METEPPEFIQSSWLGKQRLSKIVDLSSLPVNNDNNNNNNNDNNKHMGGAVGLFVMYGSWNCPPRDNAGLLRLFYAMLFPQRREEDDVKYVTGMVQVDECEDELDACCGDDDGTTTPSSSLLPCPPSSLPAALLILRKSSMKQPEIRYLSSLSSSEILKYWKDSVAPIPESILVEIQQTLRSFGMLQSTIPSFGLSSLLEKQPPSPALRIFIAGDRMSVGKTSVCLGLLANLVSKGYHPRELAYIKPATQNEKPQLVQKYCEYLGIPCIPIGPVVYYRGFTRAFLAGETEPSHELLQKVEVAVDALAHNKKVVIVDGVGHPAVGSICGTDNASVARASGYPSSTEDKQQQQQCRRQPPGVLVVGGYGRGRVFPTATSKLNGSTRSISVEREKEFQELGFLDDQGLTVFDTLHQMQVRSCDIYAENDLFGSYNEEDNCFKYITYGEFGESVDRCRAVLKDLGVEEYGKVAIISNNRLEWATIAAAAYSLNASLVPMYEAQLPSDWTYILNDSGSCVVFCATQEIFDDVQSRVLPSTPTVKASVCLDAPEGSPHAFATLMAAHDDNEGSLISEPTPEDLANLIYTSGTTGQPKGVELTHLNFSSNTKSATRSLVDNPREFVRESDRSLAFLPWAHSYGQTSELWASMSMGSGMGICRGIPHILEDLQMVQPTLLFSVPTLYKKVYDGVHNLIQEASPIRKKLMMNALTLGDANARARNGVGRPLGPINQMKFSVLDKIVLSKIRDRFGGNLRCGFLGGSACPSEVLSFMDALGIPICEGYGLTETSPIITVNVPGKRSIGSVGTPIGGVAVYIVDEEGNALAPGEEGEICCVGPNVMKGYYNNKEATDEVISVAPDGVSRMFHTGDLGRMGEDGFLRVTGRIKEQYKLENGKYVVPTPIESAIGMSRYVNQIVLSGANRPYNIALIVPEWPAIRTDLKLDDEMSEEDMANDERVKALIDSNIQESCSKLKKFEIPKKWAFVAPFTAANNMLTPKMSIRRHKVVEAYEDVISHLYGEDRAILEEKEKEAA